MYKFGVILKLKLAATCCVKVMNLGLKMLEICLFVSRGSRVEAVAEAVVAEAAWRALHHFSQT